MREGTLSEDTELIKAKRYYCLLDIEKPFYLH